MEDGQNHERPQHQHNKFKLAERTKILSIRVALCPIIHVGTLTSGHRSFDIKKF
jgi:hypothetical protein